MQTLSFPCAAPNENGCVVSCLHLGKQILVSKSFAFHFVFYFISGYFFLLVYFFSFAIKTCLVPISSRQEKIMSHFFILLLARVLTASLKKSANKNQSIWPPPAFLKFSLCLMNFLLFQFYYYSLEKDNAIQVSLKPLLFLYKMRIHCKCIQFIIYLLLVPISTVLQSNKRVFNYCN